jgi:hypothetical protein
MSKWKDATRYTRSEIRAGKPVDAFSVKSGKLKIFISNAHPMYADAWVCTCDQIAIHSFSLGLPASAPAKEAQARAYALVGDAITDLRDDFLKISEE